MQIKGSFLGVHMCMCMHYTTCILDLPPFSVPFPTFFRPAWPVLVGHGLEKPHSKASKRGEWMQKAGKLQMSQRSYFAVAVDLFLFW